MQSGLALDWRGPSRVCSPVRGLQVWSTTPCF